MIIGITGLKGFLGSSVSQFLSRKGYQVHSLDRYTRPGGKDLLNECPSGMDWVLHFAACTSIKASFEDPFSTYSNNLESTLLALKIADHSNASFLFMSSYVYGIPQYLPIDEKHPVGAKNPYMGSKIAGEVVCGHLSNMLKIPLVILRGFNIYGDWRNPGRLISDLLESSWTGKQLALNDPEPKRDYLYIQDFQRLILKIIDQEPVKTGIYNVGYGKSFSNLEVAEIVQKLANNKFSIAVKSRPRPNDIPECVADTGLLKKTFSWAPAYSLPDGLQKLIKARASAPILHGE